MNLVTSVLCRVGYWSGGASHRTAFGLQTLMAVIMKQRSNCIVVLQTYPLAHSWLRIALMARGIMGTIVVHVLRLNDFGESRTLEVISN